MQNSFCPVNMKTIYLYNTGAKFIIKFNEVWAFSAVKSQFEVENVRFTDLGKR